MALNETPDNPQIAPQSTIEQAKTSSFFGKLKNGFKSKVVERIKETRFVNKAIEKAHNIKKEDLLSKEGLKKGVAGTKNLAKKAYQKTYNGLYNKFFGGSTTPSSTPVETTEPEKLVNATGDVVTKGTGALLQTTENVADLALHTAGSVLNTTENIAKTGVSTAATGLNTVTGGVAAGGVNMAANGLNTVLEKADSAVQTGSATVLDATKQVAEKGTEVVLDTTKNVAQTGTHMTVSGIKNIAGSVVNAAAPVQAENIFEDQKAA